jgi:hypothetical protein
MKKLSKEHLEKINGAACPGGCPYPAGTTFGPPGSGATRTCQQYAALTDCCKGQYLVMMSCIGPLVN